MTGVPRPGTYEVVEDVRRIAREHGYAVGVHGSLLRDLDLIACPWTARAHAASTLVAAIEAGLDDFFLQSPATPRKPTAARAHGRLGWVFLRIGPRGPAFLDLSVMPRV